MSEMFGWVEEYARTIAWEESAGNMYSVTQCPVANAIVGHIPDFRGIDVEQYSTGSGLHSVYHEVPLDVVRLIRYLCGVGGHITGAQLREALAFVKGAMGQ